MSSNPAVTIGVSATDTASKVLAGVDNSVNRTTTNVESSGTKMQSTTGRISATVRAHFTDIATSAATLGASVVSFATSFDVLEKAQVRAQQASLTYQKAQRHLEELQTSGKATAKELSEAQEAVAIAQDKARLAQDSASDTYTNFLANVPLQMIGFLTSANGLFTMLSGRSIPSLISGLNLFRAASITAFITNPIGIALIAITTLVTLLVFNVGGLRDMFYSVGVAVLDFLRKFTPLGIAIDFFINNVLKPLGVNFDESVPQAAASTTTSLEEIQAQATETGGNVTDFTAVMQDTQANMKTEMPSASAIARASLIDMSTQVNDTSGDMTALGTAANAAMQSLSGSFTAGADNVSKSVSRMRSNVRDLISDLNRLIAKQKEAGVSSGKSYSESSSRSDEDGEKRRTRILKATSQSVRGVGI